MKKFLKLSQIFLLLILLSSCKKLFNEEKIIDGNEENINENINLENNQNKIEIRFSCGEDGISEYTDDGWKIVEEYTEEKICTWKSVPASKDCNMEKDKGCKITKPDKIGE